MSPQLSLLDKGSTDKLSGLATTRHINHDLIGTSGLQNIEAVPGLRFLDGFLTPEEQLTA